MNTASGRADRTPGTIISWPVERVHKVRVERRADELAVEEPLEIQIMLGPEDAREVKTVSIAMRTPGKRGTGGWVFGGGRVVALLQIKWRRSFSAA